MQVSISLKIPALYRFTAFYIFAEAIRGPARASSLCPNQKKTTGLTEPLFPAMQLLWVSSSFHPPLLVRYATLFFSFENRCDTSHAYRYPQRSTLFVCLQSFRQTTCGNAPYCYKAASIIRLTLLPTLAIA